MTKTQTLKHLVESASILITAVEKAERRRKSLQEEGINVETNRSDSPVTDYISKEALEAIRFEALAGIEAFIAEKNSRLCEITVKILHVLNTMGYEAS